MEEKIDLMERLNQQIEAILQRYESLKAENDMLRNELVSTKAQSELKDGVIAKLEEEMAMKELEVEEIVDKIEGILG